LEADGQSVTLIDVEVRAIGTRRGPYSEARELYEDCGSAS